IYNHSVVQPVGYAMTQTNRLNATFAALADPTRRAILARLARGEAGVLELAKPFSMSQPAISKHLRVLERARLISRGRDRPRRLVFEAYTKPEYLRRWLLGPPGWEMVVCDVATKVGDRYRYEWRNAEGTQFGIGGVCREFARPEKIVCTELMDGYTSESLVT